MVKIFNFIKNFKKEVSNMLYYKFDLDNFINPKHEVRIREFKNGKQIREYKKIEEENFGEIVSLFFSKFHSQFGDIYIGMAGALYDIIDIPINSYCIDDKDDEIIEKLIDYALKKFIDEPITELQNKSLSDLGIKLVFVKKIKSIEVNSTIKSFMEKENLEYLTEAVLWKNMTTEEKSSIFVEKLQSINSKNSELIIIDPYLFYKEDKDYCNLLAKVIKKSEAKNIIVITDEKNYSKTCFDLIKEASGYQIDIKFNSDLHDRFWISDRKEAFYTGTSFNGIGKKISLMNDVNYSDLKEIIEVLIEQELIPNIK